MGEVHVWSKETLRSLLEKRDHLDAITVASRAALRAIPDIQKLYVKNPEKFRTDVVLPVFRATRISTTGGLCKYVSDWKFAGDAAFQSSTHAADYLKKHVHDFQSPAYHAVNTAANIVFYGSSEPAAISASLTVGTTDWIDVGLELGSLINGENVIGWPQWRNGIPASTLESWTSLRTELNDAEEEDWGVWIDWYEGLLVGAEKMPPNLALEEAILLIPNEIWDAGPKVTNAEIRRLMQLHARETLDEVVSPEPVIVAGKVTVAANVEADVPDDLVAILALPERLGEAIDTLLDMLAVKANACPVIVPPLGRYRAHLDTYGPRPMLDRLNDLHQIVRDEYLGLHRERFFDTERGLRRALLIFFALHKEFRAEFAKDPVREQAIRSYRLDRDRLDAPGLVESIDAFEQGAVAMVEAEAGTSEFLDYITELSEAMRNALRTPDPGPPIAAEPDDPLVDPIPNEKPWPVRYLLKGSAFAGRLLKLLENPYAAIGTTASIAGFLASEAGAAFVAAVRNLWKLIFGI